MKTITMVKYTAEQIDKVLAILASVAGDSKAYGCSLPMMSVVLDINNYLREDATVYEEIISESNPDAMLKENEETEQSDMILNAGDANV